MFYVYKNTTKDSEIIAEFSDRNQALEYMEFHAMRDCNPTVLGYSVRDFALNTYAEI